MPRTILSGDGLEGLWGRIVVVVVVCGEKVFGEGVNSGLALQIRPSIVEVQHQL
jgi:hypothetical protein